MRRTKFAVLTIALLAAFSSLAADVADVKVTKETVATFYRGFTRLTKEPRQIGAATSAACSYVGSTTVNAGTLGIAGPHTAAQVHYYANPLGEKAITDRAATFPAGSIIVKEKLAQDNSVTAVAGMIKHSAGYDADHGDWEYFYNSKSDGFATGHLENCVACHQHAQGQDYVYQVRSFAK